MEQVAIGGGADGRGPAWRLGVMGAAGVEPSVIGGIEGEGAEEGVGVSGLVECEGGGWVKGDGVAVGGEPSAELSAEAGESGAQTAAGVFRFGLGPEELTEVLAGVGAGFKRQIEQQGEFVTGGEGEGLIIECDLGVAIQIQGKHGYLLWWLGARPTGLHLTVISRSGADGRLTRNECSYYGKVDRLKCQIKLNTNTACCLCLGKSELKRGPYAQIPTN